MEVRFGEVSEDDPVVAFLRHSGALTAETKARAAVGGCSGSDGARESTPTPMENEGEDTEDTGAGVLPQEELRDADDEAHGRASHKGRGSSRAEEKKRHTPDELGVTRAWRVLEMAREPHDNPDKGCHARAPKAEAVSEEGLCDIINLHIGGRSPDTSYLISLTTNPIWAIWWGCRAIALKKQKRVIIAELDLQKFDVVYDASSYEACDRLGIKYQMHQHFAVSASELLVFGIDEKHLTKRLLFIDPELSVHSKIVLRDVCPKDREVDPATGELVRFGGFRKYLEAFEAKFPVEHYRYPHHQARGKSASCAQQPWPYRERRAWRRAMSLTLSASSSVLYPLRNFVSRFLFFTCCSCSSFIC